MNGTSCILCDGESFRVVEPAVRDNRFGSPGSWRILACESCGLWQTDPVPTQGELQALYERHYNFGGEGETGSAWARLRALFLSSPLYRLMLRADGDVSFHARRGQGRLLDVGCNEGRGLSIYAANGFRAEGLELNRVAAEAARATSDCAHHSAGVIVRTDSGSKPQSRSSVDSRAASKCVTWNGTCQLIQSLP